MTTETKRDSLPILKDRVSLSPELMRFKLLAFIVLLSSVIGMASAVTTATYGAYNTVYNIPLGEQQAIGWIEIVIAVIIIGGMVIDVIWTLREKRKGH